MTENDKMSVNVLPDMDEPRMKYLGNQLNRSRKSSLIMHDKMKSTLDTYVKSVNNSEKREHGKYQLKGMRLKKKLARVRGTQKVLKSKREASFMKPADYEFPFGVYEGENLDSYRREIDDIIKKRHPKYRRQKEVEQHLRNGMLNGRLIDTSTAKMEFEEIMTRGYRTKVNRNPLLRRENPLTQTFFHNPRKNYDYFGRGNEAEIYTPIGKRGNLTPGTPRTGGTPGTPRTPDERGIHSRASDTKSVESNVVTLPALTVSKEFLQSRNRPKTKLMLPNLGIRRATKCSAMNDQIYLNTNWSQLKGRRASTFM